MAGNPPPVPGPWRTVAPAIIAAVVCIIALVGLVTFLSDPFGAWKRKAVQEANRADVATVQATTARAGQTAAQEAASVVDKGSERERVTITIRQENSRAILTAPGAQGRLDPELVRRARRGLCEYAAYHDDPACAEVRAFDPAVLSNPVIASPAAGGGR